MVHFLFVATIGFYQILRPTYVEPEFVHWINNCPTLALLNAGKQRGHVAVLLRLKQIQGFRIENVYARIDVRAINRLFFKTGNFDPIGFDYPKRIV